MRNIHLIFISIIGSLIVLIVLIIYQKYENDKLSTTINNYELFNIEERSKNKYVEEYLNKNEIDIHSYSIIILLNKIGCYPCKVKYYKLLNSLNKKERIYIIHNEPNTIEEIQGFKNIDNSDTKSILNHFPDRFVILIIDKNKNIVHHFSDFGKNYDEICEYLKFINEVTNAL